MVPTPLFVLSALPITAASCFSCSALCLGTIVLFPSAIDLRANSIQPDTSVFGSSRVKKPLCNSRLKKKHLYIYIYIYIFCLSFSLRTVDIKYFNHKDDSVNFYNLESGGMELGFSWKWVIMLATLQNSRHIVETWVTWIVLFHWSAALSSISS
jgi:hypothetical protein